MPRHPALSPSLEAIAGSVYSALAHRLDAHQGESYPFHVGDTWMEPAELASSTRSRFFDLARENESPR